MEYIADDIFKGVAGVAAKGWKLVKLYGVRDDLRCTCGKPDCQNTGKHPIGDGWHLRATDDEESIGRWFDGLEDHSRINVGVRLGATSGIIDVEYDSPEAEQALKKYGLDTIDTPAYSSGRGVHRIFQHEDWMPDSAVIKVDGIEVRIGGGGAASQSVIPPSWHRTGVQYQWLPGRSPDEVCPAKLPDAFREAVMAGSRLRMSGTVARARKTLQAGKRVTAGGRHEFLLGIASKHAARVLRFTEDERAELVQTLLCVNEVMCDPPKGDSEVIKIAHDQLNYYQQRAIARRQGDKYRYESYGLSWNYEDNCWEPGLWRLTVVRMDPPEMKLRIPHPNPELKDYIEVRLTCGEWTSPKCVAQKILESSSARPGWRSIDLCYGRDGIGKWTATWNGGEGEGGTERLGLKGMLYADYDEEIPPRDTNSSTYRAAVVLSYIDSVAKSVSGDGEESQRPKQDGKPKWILSPKTGEWRLWLKWPQTVAEAWSRMKIGSAPPMREQNAMRSAIEKEAGFSFLRQSVTVDGKQGQWWVMTESHVEALRKIADAI